MRALSGTTPRDDPNWRDPSQCETQAFCDRDVKIIRCCEKGRCRHRKFYNNMVICDHPFNEKQD